MNKEIEYLKEHLYEIYKYKKSMKDLTYDMDIEHLLRTCKALDYSQKEIERLNNIINELEEELERESNMKEEDTCLEHNTFIDIKNTLKTVLKRLQELKGSDK